MAKDRPYDPGGTLFILLVISQAVYTFEIPESATAIPIESLFSNNTWYDLLLDLLVAENGEVQPLPFELRKLDKIIKFAKKQQILQESFSERFLSINRGGKFRGDLLVWLPVSFVLPTLKKKKKHQHYKRSTSSQNYLTQLDELKAVYNPNSTDYIFDPNFGPLLSRLDGYYGLLDVRDEPCQYLFDCYAGVRSDQLSPVSDLLSQLYRTSEKYLRPTTFSKPLLKFFRHYWAFKKGASNREYDCDSEYRNCNTTVDDYISFPTLKFWQDLSSLLSIQLQDE